MRWTREQHRKRSNSSIAGLRCMPLVAAVCMLCSCASHPSKPEPESAATPLELRLSTRMAAESAATVEPDDKAATAAVDAPRAPVSASGDEPPVPQADSNTAVETPDVLNGTASCRARG